MNLDGKDPKVEVEYDETDEIFLEECHLQEMYKAHREEEETIFQENLAEMEFEEGYIRNLIKKEESDE